MFIHDTLIIPSICLDHSIHRIPGITYLDSLVLEPNKRKALCFPLYNLLSIGHKTTGRLASGRHSSWLSSIEDKAKHQALSRLPQCQTIQKRGVSTLYTLFWMSLWKITNRRRKIPSSTSERRLCRSTTLPLKPILLREDLLLLQNHR